MPRQPRRSAQPLGNPDAWICDVTDRIHLFCGTPVRNWTRSRAHGRTGGMVARNCRDPAPISRILTFGNTNKGDEHELVLDRPEKIRGLFRSRIACRVLVFHSLLSDFRHRACSHRQRCRSPQCDLWDRRVKRPVRVGNVHTFDCR